MTTGGLTDELLPKAPPDPEDGGGPDVDTDPVEDPTEDPTAEPPAGVEP